MFAIGSHSRKYFLGPREESLGAHIGRRVVDIERAADREHHPPRAIDIRELFRRQLVYILY
jgi:hypothetical protein